VPFRRRFARAERDYSRAEDIIRDELPGVLISALKGLKRLRTRGDFDVPRVCSELRDTWRDDSNPLYGFMSDYFEKDKKSSVSVASMWELYQLWASENGINSRYALSKKKLNRSVESLGFSKRRGSGGRFVFDGLRATVDIDEADE